MKKVEVKIEVRNVFKCAKPAIAQSLGNEMDTSNNTQDPTLTVTLTTVSSILAKR